MRQAFRHLFNQSFCLLAMLPLIAQGKAAKGNSPPPQSETGGAFKELMKEWWLWGGIVAILVLLGVLYYVKKNQDED